MMSLGMVEFKLVGFYGRESNNRPCRISCEDKGIFSICTKYVIVSLKDGRTDKMLGFLVTV